MTSCMARDTNEGILIDWVPNFIAEMPLHLQLTKVILTKVYTLGTTKIAYLPSVKKLSQKFRVPGSVIIQAYEQLQNFGLATTLNGTRLRILSKPSGDLASKLRLVNHYHLQANPRHFVPHTQFI